MISLTTYKRVISRCYGKEIAEPLYAYWQAINLLFYQGKLPPPLITFEIMPYGACVGLTTKSRGHIRLIRPMKKEALQINAYSIGILLHENIHYAEPYIVQKVLAAPLIKWTKGIGNETSHNSVYWINEVNRIHEQVTGVELGAGFQVVKRVGPKGKKKLRRVNEGKIDRSQIASYPHSIKGTEEKIFHYLSKNIDKKQFTTYLTLPSFIPPSNFSGHLG
jgi:hypothetical protein